MLQASEGGSISVGNQKFKVKASVTPPPVVTPPVTLISGATRRASPVASPLAGPLEGTPVAMPPNMPRERIARAPSSRFSTLAAATDKIVVSKSVLIGLCLTTFAFGIVTTLAADRIHARANEASAPREPEPVVLRTTPIEPEGNAPAAENPPVHPAPAPAAQAAPAPAARAAPAPAEATPPAVAEAVVVQLAPASETAPRLPVRAAPPRATRQAAAAPTRPTPEHATPTPRKRASAVLENAPTEAAPDDGPLPAPVKKKWVDPFDQ